MMTPGFAVEIQEDTVLSGGILVAEFDDGSYQPVAVVSCLQEARELADGEARARMRQLEGGGMPACPEAYAIWAQGIGGIYRVVKTLAWT